MDCLPMVPFEQGETRNEVCRRLSDTLKFGVWRAPGLLLLGHDDPQDDVGDRAGEADGNDGDENVEDSDEGGVPAEPRGDAAADSGDDLVVSRAVKVHRAAP